MKLFDPTIMVLGELVLELPPEDEENPQALSVVTNVMIRTEVKSSFFVILPKSFLKAPVIHAGDERKLPAGSTQ